MNKEWWGGTIEACQALRDGKEAQLLDCDRKWHTMYTDDKGRISFDFDCKYRAKPEPKFRALTPQEWLEALLAGKTIGQSWSFCLRVTPTGTFIIEVPFLSGYYTTEEMLNRKFSDGSPCGVEVVE